MRRPFSRFASVLGALALVMSLAACSDEGAGAPVPADAIAVVNGQPVPLDVFEATLDALATSDEATEAPTGDELNSLERDVASLLVQSELIGQLGEDLDVAPTQEDLDEAWEVDPAVAEQADSYGMTRAQFEEWLITPSLVVERLPAALAVDAAEEDLSVVASVSHILVETRRQANTLLTRLDEGEEFEVLAAEESLDTGSAANGGSLGVDQPLSQYVPAFATAATDAALGEVVGPVRTQFGFHLIRVDDRGEVASQEAVQSGVFEAYAAAEVNVTSRLGVWDGENGVVVDQEPVGTGTDAPAATEGAGN